MAQSGPRLTDTLGRNEFRVYSEPFPLSSGVRIAEIQLVKRLEARHYARVHSRPKKPGTFFWGKSHFRIYRRAFHFLGKEIPDELIVLKLNSSGRISGLVGEDKTIAGVWRREDAMLEPIVLSESMTELRAERLSLPFKSYPSGMIDALLAAEDSRFFEHHGLDSKAIARSMLKNVKAGRIVMGGSTLTQQLIKNRDLTPKRSFSRKASEAIRALILESEYSKEEILEAYMNHVYLGHVSGIAIHGFPAGARAWFSKSLKQLSTAQYAYLAGMVQGPNLYNPKTHLERGIKRRNWVLGRMKKLSLISGKEYSRSIKEKGHVAVTSPRVLDNRTFFHWSLQVLQKEKSSWFRKKRGAKVFTTLDPLVQQKAHLVLNKLIPKLARKMKRNWKAPLAAALVCMDLESGGILAYANYSTQSKGSSYDRVRMAHRQPGSTIKPFVLLAAFDRFRNPLYPGTLVLDSPFVLGKKPHEWKPKNYDKKFHGIVSLRESLVQSYNIPIAKTANHLGFDVLGGMLHELGLNPNKSILPSISLGAAEATPLDLLEAYSCMFCGGKTREAIPVFGAEKPSGSSLKRIKSRRKRIARSSSAYLIYDLLLNVMKEGTGRNARLNSASGASWYAGKTGTSSNYRDAWFVGASESLLTVVWVGRDNNKSLGLPSSQTASLIWKEFMEEAVPLRPRYKVNKPSSVKTCKINPHNGLRVFGILPGYKKELYRRGGAPDREIPWKTNHSQVID